MTCIKMEFALVLFNSAICWVRAADAFETSTKKTDKKWSHFDRGHIKQLWPHDIWDIGFHYPLGAYDYFPFLIFWKCPYVELRFRVVYLILNSHQMSHFDFFFLLPACLPVMYLILRRWFKLKYLIFSAEIPFKC